MRRCRPFALGKDRISIRVLLPRKDYESLCEIAEQDRNDIGSLVRRAIARFYLMPGTNSSDNQTADRQFEESENEYV